MSSMRNAAPRRPHKERSQPGARSKWGLLEKHKDYSLRAADYNQKKKKLNLLSAKSRTKNPDEFAFGMLSSDSQKAGKHGRGDTQKNRLSVDEVKLFKGQDAGYLRTVLGRTRREVEKVTEEITLDEVLKRRGTTGGENEKKTLFDSNGLPLRKKRRISSDSDNDDDDDDDEDIDVDGDDLSADLEVPTTIEQPTSTSTSILTTQPSNPDLPLSSIRPPPPSQDLRSKSTLLKRQRKRIREARESKLLALKSRQKSITAAAAELELQRAKMARTIGGTNRNGVKFKVRERKR